MASEMNSRRGAKTVGLLIRPQAVSDKSYIESVVGFIHDVVPQAYTSTTKQEEKEKVTWVKFEYSDVNDYKFYKDIQPNGNTPPLLLVLGYTNGVQVWTVPANGDAQEVLSWRQGPVRSLKFLPTPITDNTQDIFESKRPIVALCDSSSAGQQFCAVNFVSLQNADQVQCLKFKSPVQEVVCNKRVVVVSFQEKICIYDACSLKEMCTVMGCFPSVGPCINPLALGPRWLAFADRKLHSLHQTCGGMSGDGVQSYTATVIHAAKTITKGLSMFGETVASSLSGHKGSVPSTAAKKAVKVTEQLSPGIVTVVDFMNLGKGEIQLDDDSENNGIIAHFPAHTNEPISALAFDPSGMLLFTACRLGHNFHIFRIFPYPTSSSLGAVHHLYTLHRGDTTAKVQDIAFSIDSRWVAVSTLRGTTHIFPITPYGGPVSVRTHISPRVVNKYSRFQKSAGLEDIQQPSNTGRNSPVLSASPGSSGTIQTRFFDSHPSIPYHTNSSGKMVNPRLPPYPHPTTVLPLAQLKQPAQVLTLPGMGTSASAKSQSSKSASAANSNEIISVAVAFATPRAWLVGSPSLNREKRDKRPVDALFVIGCHGNLLEYTLEPKPSAVSGTTSNKIADDSPIDLEVVAHAQWPLRRFMNSPDVKPPLSASNAILMANEFPKGCSWQDNKTVPSVSEGFSDASRTEDKNEDLEESWLSQVEIITHAGPHRRLWMGPQFSFKTIPHMPNTTILSSTSSALLSQSPESSGSSSLDMYTDEPDLQSLSIRPQSNPVAVPTGLHTAEDTASPLLIEATSGSFEHSTSMLEVYGSCTEGPVTVVASPIVRDREDLEDHLKETLADAMVESPCRDYGRFLSSHESLQ